MIYVSDLNSYSRALARLRSFEALGLEVAPIQSAPRGDPALGYARLGLAPKILARLGVSLDWPGAGRVLLEELRRAPADIVWIDKGVTLRPGLLRRIKSDHPGAKLVFFSEDDMFLAHNQTSRFRRGLPIYDMVFTTKARNVDPGELPSLGARRVCFVRQAFDPHQHHPIALTDAEAAEFAADVSFIGSYEEARAQSMLYLAQNGVTVRVWGNGWTGRSLDHPNLRIEGRPLVNTPGQLNFTKGVAATSINLCFLRKLNRDQHTSRTFEIPAIGGFMLAERTAEHQALFSEDKEAAFFGDDPELLSKVRYFLDNPERRLEIAAAGHLRCVAAYGSEAQAREMLARIA